MTEARVSVTVEVMLLSSRNEALCYRIERRALSPDVEPDDVARSAAAPAPDSGGVLHSTSWRFEDGQVILTYVALPDPEPAAERRFVAGSVARSDDAAAPNADAGEDEVAAHACRHLAFLASTDPEVADGLARHAELNRLLRRYAPDVAGEVR